jgi:hypothetical protein
MPQQVNARAVTMAPAVSLSANNIPARNGTSTLSATISTGTEVPANTRARVQFREVSNTSNLQYSITPNSTSPGNARQKIVDLTGGGVSTGVSFTITTSVNNNTGGSIISVFEIVEVTNCQDCVVGTPGASQPATLTVVAPPTGGGGNPVCTPSPIFLSWCSDYDWDLCACVGVIDKSPIVIDVEGNGFDLTDAQHGVNFDLNADGLPDPLSWTAADSDDAWLVLDRNANGRIDDGTELFGNLTPQLSSVKPNGFKALWDLDSLEVGGNDDMVLDRRDNLFPLLQLWQDKNHNGISEPEELHPLSFAGIKGLSLDFNKSKRIDRNGNQFRYRAKIRAGKHSSVGRLAWDVLLTLAQ